MASDKLGVQLLNEYSDAIEPATLLAIISDYDLSDATQFATASETLDLIRATAVTEQESGFDPSGASGRDINSDGGNDEESRSAQSVLGGRSQTDDTSLSQELSSLELEGSEYADGDGAYTSREESLEKPYTSELAGLDGEGKEKTLVAIFPALKPFDVKWTLKKCKGNIDLAIDELMTESFLEESGGRHRGIEAFSEAGVVSRPRKGKGKKKRGYRNDVHTPTSPTEETIQSKWDVGKKDVEFISEKTGIPVSQIATTYHQNGASFTKTISAIIEAYTAVNLEDDPVIDIHVYELRQEFPTIPGSALKGLIQITNPSLHHARALAQELSSRPSAQNGGLQISFQHAAIDTSSPKPKPTAHNAINPDLPLDAGAAALAAASHRHTRDTAFVQAGTAYRRGKSDHLMGGVAAYYSQLGREADARVKIADARAADALVAAQSTGNMLDLHGVSVKDALRIAREKVEGWWIGLGEERALAQGRKIGNGFNIVTGIGRHSEGGRSKIGPAVGKMLVSEGWKVEVGTGNLLVRGKVKF